MLHEVYFPWGGGEINGVLDFVHRPVF
jgi:hypothetical protein